MLTSRPMQRARPELFAKASGRVRFATPLVLALLALGACDAQVGSAYQGEPLALLTGRAELASSPPRTGVDACLIWYDVLGHEHAVGPQMRLEGAFPSSFQLPITTPPGVSLLNDFTFGGRYPDEARIGVGVFAALPVGAHLTGAHETAAAVAPGYVVAWVERDVRPGTASAAFLGGPLARGFYVLAVTPSATYDQAHPDANTCAGAGRAPGECPLAPTSAYADCIETARRAAGCLGPRAGVDRLAPTVGFDTPLVLAIDSAGVSLAEPNLW